MSTVSQLAVDVEHLTFAHQPGAAASLIDLSLKLPPGSRTLLIGANGGVHSKPIV